jgi:hypothetical protein
MGSLSWRASAAQAMNLSQVRRYAMSGISPKAGVALRRCSRAAKENPDPCPFLEPEVCDRAEHWVSDENVANGRSEETTLLYFNPRCIKTRNAPSNSNRFTLYLGFGFRRRHGTRPATFRVTYEAESGAHPHPASHSTFRSTVRGDISSGDRHECGEDSVER